MANLDYLACERIYMLMQDACFLENALCIVNLEAPTVRAPSSPSWIGECQLQSTGLSKLNLRCLLLGFYQCVNKI